MRKRRIFILKVLLLVFLGMKWLMTEFGYRFAHVGFAVIFGLIRFGLKGLPVFVPLYIILLELIGGLIFRKEKRAELYLECQEIIEMIEEAIEGHKKEN